MRGNESVRCLAGLALAVAFTACAQERAPINRVQAQALAKSFFVGPNLSSAADDPEFYKRGTVVDVGYGAGQEGLFTSTYGQPVSRIRWEITEDALHARLSYERIAGTDGKGNKYNGTQPKTSNDGQIVASYRIESHFDIKREYNPQTGEQLNVIVENSSDRPWFDREHFRVDWSKNLISTSYDYDTLSLLGIIGAVTYEPHGYTVLDPLSPDAPHFVPNEGYFDVTNKVYAKPQQLDLAVFGGSGSIPACMLPVGNVTGGTEPWGNCNPIELTIRESYRKVTDTDYEPMSMDGVRFSALGAFNFDYRRGYARNYGLLDQEWSRFIARYNIWERSHFYNSDKPIACATKASTEDATGDPSADPNRDGNNDGTADECAGAGAGSRCDVYTQKCTLPYRQRKVKTIPWYIAGDTSLFEATNWATLEWDLAMKTAVQTSRLVECRKTKGGNCDQSFPMWRGQQDDNDEAVRIAREIDGCRRMQGFGSESCNAMAKAAAAAIAAERGSPGDTSTLAIGELAAMPPVIVLCHNPVGDHDHPACGSAGLVVRTGDIRYNTVQNIANPQTPSPWGILADGNDPLTGEKVVGSINLWTATTDSAAQQLVDMVRYINGEIATPQITNGSYIQNWADAAKLGSAQGLPTLSRADINKRLASATALDPAAFQAIANAPLDPELRASLAAGKARAADVQVRNDVPSPGQLRLQATLNLGRGSTVQNQLINPAMLQLTGVPANVSVGAATGVASPLGMANPLTWSRVRQLRENALAARGSCVLDEAPEPTAMTGLAGILAKKFPAAQGESPSAQQDRYDRMFHYIQQRYQYAVIAHEMGHSIGLRHNFVSSSASLHYRPQYWQLRTKNGQVKTPCTDAVADGATCVGPRYWDPVTEEEQSQMIWMFMQSTVMEYPGDISQDLIGLGVTDFASARFFYGDNVSVYTDPQYMLGTDIGAGVMDVTDDFGGLLGIQYGKRVDGSLENFHYAQLQNNYEVIKGCYPVTPKPPAGWDEKVGGKWDQVMDGQVVSIDGKPTKCRQQPVDYVGFTELRRPTAAEGNSPRGGPNVDPNNRLRVPYGFATDHWADTGNASVFRFDNGADPYEQVQFLIATKENRHIFDNFRRGRTSFSLLGAAQRSFNRYNVKLQGLSGGVGFLQSIYRDIVTNQGYSFDTYWPLVVQGVAHDNVIAATVAFDHFVRELSRPEPGPHYRRAALFNDPVLHAATDADDFGPPTGVGGLGQTQLVIPNGTSGFLRDLGFGGHPLENSLSSRNGDFNSEYYDNAGSYYDKINTAILLAESEDRFISQSRRDFYDARFRAIGMADVMPDGFRRVLANALTGDRSILAPRVAASAGLQPLLDSMASVDKDPLANRYPQSPLGWPSFWPKAGPEICFSTQGRAACTNYAGDADFDPATPIASIPVDPQIGWEVQKFLITWSVALIKANEKTNWTDMMRIWRLGQNASPEIDQRIEWQDPTSGEVYYARSMGSECLFGTGPTCVGGRIVQKGIAARVLEYANQLTAGGYKLDTVAYPATLTHAAGFNNFGRAIVMRHPSGTPIILADKAIRNVTPAGMLADQAECDQNLTPTCTPLTPPQNHFAYELLSYKSVPDYLWQAELTYGWFADPSQRGTF